MRRSPLNLALSLQTSEIKIRESRAAPSFLLQSLVPFRNSRSSSPAQMAWRRMMLGEVKKFSFYGLHGLFK